MLNLIKALLQQLDITIVTIIRKINKLQLNIYYIKFSKMCSFSLLNILFSYIANNLNIIFKIFQISVLFLFIYRLVIILLGYDYILAPHQIELDLLIDFFNNIYSQLTLYKNQYLQWLINQLNSFISHDINSNISPTIESNINQPSLRADYKQINIHNEIDSSFYKSPYFYIPVVSVAIIILSIFGGMYYLDEIFDLWFYFNELDVNNQGHIYTPNKNPIIIYGSETKSPSNLYKYIHCFKSS